jgi:two-component system sensor histidine kinase/response regulator
MATLKTAKMPLRIPVILCLLFASTVSLAQKWNTDSIEHKIRLAQADTNKVILLNNLITDLREKDLNRANDLAEEAYELSVKLNYKRGLGHALENMGWLSYRSGDYSTAFELSMEAIKINGEINAKAELAQCFNNIAAINFEQRQYILAIDNFKKAFRIGKEIGDDRVICRSLNNIAFAFVTKHEIDSARHYAVMALREGENASDKYMIGFSRRILGDIFFEEKSFRQSVEYYQSCIAIANAIDNNALRSSTLHRMGRIYNEMRNPDAALRYLLPNIALSEKYGFKDELERSYKLASEAYALKHDIDHAFEYQSKYVAIHDDIYNQKNSERLSLMQIKFDTHVKEAEIDLLTKESMLKKQEIDRQRVWMFFYSGCLSLLLILAFVLFSNNSRFKKVNRLLAEQNKKIHGQAQQLSNLNTTKDKLFSIISHDLRSPVASLKGMMEILSNDKLSQTEFARLTRQLHLNLDSLYDDLDNLLQWAQSQLKGLQPAPEVVNLKKAVEEKFALFHTSAKNKGVSLINDVDESVKVFADKNHIGLILRNLIANAIKFNPTEGKVKVASKLRGDIVEISVSDSGIGISLDDLNKLFNAETHFTKPGTNQEKGVGIGLLITKEFVDINGGNIWVTSELGKGSEFTFTLSAKLKPVLID